MANITIRNVDAGLKTRLRARAAKHGRSIEDEAKDILRASLGGKKTKSKNLAASIRAKFGNLGGIDLPETKRQAIRPPIDFNA